MTTPLRALLVEDSADDAVLIVRELSRGGYDVTYERVDTEPDLRAALARGPWDIVLSDYAMPKLDAPAALRIVRELDPDAPLIIVSGTIGEETAVEAMRMGANDYLIKGHLKRLAPAVDRELREALEHRRRRAAEEALRKSETLLLQAQKMEAVGRLAGGVAHDFNNLLTAILGYTDLLLRDLKPEGPMTAELGEIRKCGERAASLTRQLLAFSRRQILQPRPLDLNVVVKDMNNMSRRLIGDDIRLAADLDANLRRVMADPGQMEQVIMNLVVNARDAMPAGGVIAIATANVEIPAADVEKYPEVKPGPYVMLSVRDTGVGMTKDVQQRIFEPFFTTKGEGKGTGLGLATVYGIVKQSGGHILVESAPGMGTTFRIYLPPAAGETPVQETLPIQITSLDGKETLLVVEDEDTVRDLTRRVLLKHGYQVLEASNAGEALLICEKHKTPIHLMLTDMVMPQMYGHELAKRLGGLHPEMKVIFMSGHTEADVLKQVMEMGKPFLLKPFRPVVLARKVRETLESS